MTFFEKVFCIFFIITGVYCIGLAISGIFYQNDPYIVSGIIGIIVSCLGILCCIEP